MLVIRICHLKFIIGLNDEIIMSIVLN